MSRIPTAGKPLPPVKTCWEAAAYDFCKPAINTFYGLCSAGTMSCVGGASAVSFFPVMAISNLIFQLPPDTPLLGNLAVTMLLSGFLMGGASSFYDQTKPSPDATGNKKILWAGFFASAAAATLPVSPLLPTVPLILLPVAVTPALLWERYVLRPYLSKYRFTFDLDKLSA